MSVQESANRNSKKLNITNPVGRHLIDADCQYEDGKFILSCLPDNLPSLFTVRFTAPADYAQGNTIVVRDRELPVRTPGMVNASTGLFVAGAVMHCDVDMDREIAFFWQSGGGNGGVMPNLSFDEQFAGFYDEYGDKVYFKTVDLGALPNKSKKEIPLNICGLKNLVDLKTVLKAPSGTIFGNFANQTVFDAYGVTGNNLIFSTTVNRAPATAICRIYYTCTDR